jgi:hypothetical protein
LHKFHHMPPDALALRAAAPPEEWPAQSTRPTVLAGPCIRLDDFSRPSGPARASLPLRRRAPSRDPGAPRDSSPGWASTGPGPIIDSLAKGSREKEGRGRGKWKGGGGSAWEQREPTRLRPNRETEEHSVRPAGVGDGWLPWEVSTRIWMPPSPVLGAWGPRGRASGSLAASRAGCLLPGQPASGRKNCNRSVVSGQIRLFPANDRPVMPSGEPKGPGGNMSEATSLFQHCPPRGKGIPDTREGAASAAHVGRGTGGRCERLMADIQTRICQWRRLVDALSEMMSWIGA